MSHLCASCRESRLVTNTRFLVCFVQTFTQTLTILLRFCADIWAKNWRLTALIDHLSKMVDYRPMVDNIDPVASLTMKKAFQTLRLLPHPLSWQLFSKNRLARHCPFPLPHQLDLGHVHLWLSDGSQGPQADTPHTEDDLFLEVVSSGVSPHLSRHSRQ